jgi:SAM-dependent methyltransferase
MAPHGAGSVESENKLDNFLPILACPRHHSPLAHFENVLVCPSGHAFPIQDSVPVFASHPRRQDHPANMEPWQPSDAPTPVDPFVNDWLVNTNGNLYRRARGNLLRYPIPVWPSERGDGRLLIDLGCGWGRWCLAAGRAGFRAFGVDLHLEAIAAAIRVARQLGSEAAFACAEIDRLPIATASADFVFSYSVLQHLDRAKVPDVLREVSRVLKPAGACLIQLPNRLGPLSLIRQARRGFRDGLPGTLEMRYWSRAEIAATVRRAGLELISIRTDGFFSQNPQLSDLDLLPLWAKAVVMASYSGRQASSLFPPLTRIADSLWVEMRAPASASRR